MSSVNNMEERINDVLLKRLMRKVIWDEKQNLNLPIEQRKPTSEMSKKHYNTIKSELEKTGVIQG